MKVETYKCDVCGKIKPQPTTQEPFPPNHWWVLRTQLATDGTGYRQLVICPWTDFSALHTDDEHVCGHECVQKKVSEFLSK